MIRTTALILSLTLLAGAANAAEIKISTQDKSPTQLRAAIEDAAFKTCRAAYAGDTFAVYERDFCAKETAAAAQAQVDQALASNHMAKTIRVAAR